MDNMVKQEPAIGIWAGATALKPVLIGLALLPVIMALATWDHAQSSMIRAQFAFLHYPVLIVEIVTILVAMRSGVQLFEILARWPFWALGALVVLIAVAAGTTVLVAPLPRAAAIHSLFMLVHFLFAVSLFGLIERVASARDAASFFWKAAIAASLGYVLILALYVASIPDPARFDWMRLGLGVVNVRQISFYCIVGVCAGLGCAAEARGGRWYWLGIAVASAMIGVAIWSGSRGPLVAIFAAVVGAWLLLPGVRSTRFVVAVVISVASGVLVSFVHQPSSDLYGLYRILGTATASTVDGIGSGRILVWLGTLREIGGYPFFGYGAAQFRLVVPEALGIINSPHNAILQIVLQWGVVGGLCFFGLLVSAWIRFLALARTGDDAFIPSFLVVNALLVFSLYDVVAFFAYPMVVIAIGMVLVLAAVKGSVTRTQNLPEPA